MKKTNTDTIRLSLAIPRPLKNKLSDYACAKGHKINQEIVFRILDSFAKEENLSTMQKIKSWLTHRKVQTTIKHHE